MGEGGRARDRETTQREVDKLRGSIQTLTRWLDGDDEADVMLRMVIMIKEGRHRGRRTN